LSFSLVLPTYNEAKNLPRLIPRVIKTLEQAGSDFEIIVVDDDSPDKTWQVAADMAVEEPRLKVIRRQGERGLATAVVAGWRQARGELLGVMDADLQYPPEGLPDLLQAIDEMPADVAVASRYVPGSTVERWSVLRKVISLGARLLVRLMLPGAISKLRDPGAGYFVMRRQVVALDDLHPKGFKILLEILARGEYDRVVEVPYPYEGRAEGQSKLDFRQYFDFLSHLLRLGRETGGLGRIVRFCLVGCSGVLLNLGLLWILTEFFGLYYLYSAIIAVLCAMTSNFTWNEVWTFADTTVGSRSLRQRWHRYVKFNLICAGGGVLNVGLVWFLTHFFGLHYLASAVVGTCAATLWNYGLNANVTWQNCKHDITYRPIDASEIAKKIPA
jgi:dolichol-phosphate mannosyltransferase